MNNETQRGASAPLPFTGIGKSVNNSSTTLEGLVQSMSLEYLDEMVTSIIKRKFWQVEISDKTPTKEMIKDWIQQNLHR
jgi:hypothetical protein